MNVLQDNLLSWSLLVGGLIFLAYSMKVIMNEKRSFLDESYLLLFENLQFYIPDWWDQKKISDHQIQFFRSDTRYDWKATLNWISSQETTPLTEVFDDYLAKRSIQFDPEVIVETEAKHVILNQEIAELFDEFIRVEGMASQGTERIYLDIVFMRKKGESSYFQLESLSSVLNGGVEGPYFEELLKTIEPLNLKGSLD